MKLLTLGIVLIAGFAVLAQDQPQQTPEQRQRQAQRLGAVLAQLQENGVPVNFSATNIQRDKSVLHLKGNVRIGGGGFGMSADEVDYHWDTGQIETRGQVLWRCVSTESACDPLIPNRRK